MRHCQVRELDAAKSKPLRFSIGLTGILTTHVASRITRARHRQFVGRDDRSLDSAGSRVRVIPMPQNELITHEDGNDEAWLCLCGNAPSGDGFYPCDEKGNE